MYQGGRFGSRGQDYCLGTIIVTGRTGSPAPPKSLPHEGWVGRPGDGGKLKPFAACCVILSVADRLVMFEAVDQIRCFRSGADAGRAVGRGVRIARCGNDVCRARVLQEDGGTVRGHGDGEIPSLLQGNRHVSGLSRSEDRLFAIGSCQFGSVLRASPYRPGRFVLLVGAMVVWGFVHA